MSQVSKTRKAQVATLLSEKVKPYYQRKEGHLIKIKRSIHQEKKKNDNNKHI